MSLVGNLEDLGLEDILQIVSLSRKSGILALNSRDREGRIVFFNGQVIKAQSSVSRENLGHLLLRKGLVDLATLKKALILQKNSDPQPRLGTILAENFGVSRDGIEECVKEQVEKIVYSFFGWTEGSFSFELGEPDELAATNFSPLQFMLEQGLNPQWLAMEGSRILDEKRHRGENLEEPEAEPEVDLDPLLVELSQEGTIEEENLAAAETLPPSAEEVSPGECESDEIDVSQFAEEEPVEPFSVPGENEVWIVDDDQSVLDGLARVFGQVGFQVKIFSESGAFLQRLRQAINEGQTPRLLIDLIMPRMDGSGILGGLELLEIIAREAPMLRVITLTDHPNEDAENKVRELGFSLLLGKPKRDALKGGGGEAALQDLVNEIIGRFGSVTVENAGISDQGTLHNFGRELLAELGETPEDQKPQRGPQTPGLHLLRGMLQELNNPSLGGGIILLVLRYASELMNRAVIFLVKEAEFVGLGQFGIDLDGEMADVRIRKMRIPRAEPSVLSRAMQEKTALRTDLGDQEWDAYLREQLGGGQPKEVFVGPILSEGTVVALIYGDNLPEQAEIGDTESFEIFLSQAGLAMEKALLERRLKSKEAI